MNDAKLISFTAEIIAAHVSNNRVKPDELPYLIQAVHEAMGAVAQPPPPDRDPLTPIPTIRSSLKSDSITCLECGASMKMLKRHLATKHGLSVGDYRTRWNLFSEYPLVAPDYAETRRQMAKEAELGRKPGESGS